MNIAEFFQKIRVVKKINAYDCEKQTGIPVEDLFVIETGREKLDLAQVDRYFKKLSIYYKFDENIMQRFNSFLKHLKQAKIKKISFSQTFCDPSSLPNLSRELTQLLDFLSGYLKEHEKHMIQASV